MSELVAPAQITNITTLDPGELRIIELTLPQECEIDHVRYPIRDVMRPGTAFLVKPWGSRTGKWRRRMYTRSNFAIASERKLETIINYTHTEKSDTSLWWQSDDVLLRQDAAIPLDIRLEWNEAQSELFIYESSRRCLPTNLRLEPDEEWRNMRFVALAFSTGITPFLSYIRYMKYHNFGKTDTHPGACVTLIVSARHRQQLMAHEELLDLERSYPDHVQYYPVLTQTWPPDWAYSTGRIIRSLHSLDRGAVSDDIDLSPLQSIVPDLQQQHLRFCGNKVARDQLQLGLSQQGIVPLSFRAEVW